MKKKLLIVFILMPLIGIAQPLQELSLAQAYDLAKNNYPAVKNKDLVKQTAEISISNLQKGFLPQVSLGGQLSYQSDVPGLPITIPGVSLEPAAKDQYRLMADVQQLIYDGGLLREQKNLTRLHAVAEDQKTEVELYKLKDRINQLFLGLLLMDEQLKQSELLKKDILTGLKKTEAQVQQGVAFRSAVNMLEAELLRADQRSAEIRATRSGLLHVLFLFTGRELSEGIQLHKPVAASELAGEIVRPEIKLYQDQQKLAGHQERLIFARSLPKASLFLQAGYGKPGLNMLLNEFDFFYTGGIRFNWSLNNLYTKKKEKEQVAVQQKMLEVQKDVFLLQTKAQLQQQQSEIEKFQQLIQQDQKIIALRNSVAEAANAQLENGVITASDFMKEVNAEDLARQALILHQIQLLQAKIQYQTILGKQ